MLLQDVAAGRVVAMVVRTAELFGPWIKSKDSMLMVRDDARTRARPCDAIVALCLWFARATAPHVFARQFHLNALTKCVSRCQVLIYKRLRLGGVAEWPYGCDVVQTFSYVPDVAKAIALLADTPDCFNQVRPTY
jgi:hypothetical protein